MESIINRLYELRDEQYQSFQASLLPTKDQTSIIGVRTPALRALAKELKDTQEAAAFMNALPHAFFEEDQLHAFLISQIRDFDECISAIEIFLPYVDNWATCDQMTPKVLKQQPRELMKEILMWLESDHPYTVRFAIKQLMDHYLEEQFEVEQLELVAGVTAEDYYVRMMVAWYFATALAKQYDAALPYIEEHRLPEWTHKKTIQKACESYRLSPEQKEYLKRYKN
jgi:3-methyladenine DNA glycosylase AlkD